MHGIMQRATVVRKGRRAGLSCEWRGSGAKKEAIVAPVLVVESFLSTSTRVVVDEGKGSATARWRLNDQPLEMRDNRRANQAAIGAPQVGRHIMRSFWVSLTWAS